MTMIMSLAATALFVSPVFYLAGWVKRPVPQAISSRFNGL